MPEYDVSWVIGAITAVSPQDAARQCREMLLDPDNNASVFLVQTDDGTETEVDVLALSADNPTRSKSELVAVAVGNPVDGLAFYGPVLANSPEIEQFTNHTLSSSDEWWYCPLLPLTDPTT